MLRPVRATAIVVALAVTASCGGGDSRTSGEAGSPTTRPESSTTAALVDLRALTECLRDLGAQPERRFDNALYAALVTDEGFVQAIDAWRASGTTAGYESIAFFVFGDRRALERSQARFDDPPLKIKLINRWNVLWTWDGPATHGPPPAQVEAVNGCLERAAS